MKKRVSLILYLLITALLIMPVPVLADTEVSEDLSNSDAVSEELAIDAGEQEGQEALSVVEETKGLSTDVLKETAVEITVLFDAEEGTIEIDGISYIRYPLNLISGNAVSFSAVPVREGYEFKGWYADEDLNSTDGTIPAGTVLSSDELGNAILESDTVFHAKWEEAKYSINYVLGGGTNAKTNPSEYYITSSEITLNAPTRKGYRFEGWFKDADKTQKVTSIAAGSTGDKTFYAKWKKVKYTIKYVLNGGTANKNNPSYYYVTTATKSLKSATRKGYSFAGWYSNKSLSNRVYSIKQGSTGNKTLYAKWKVKTYTVTYVLKGGKNSSRNPKTYTIKSSKKTLMNPTRKGYSFQGWYRDKGLTKKVKTIPAGSTGNKTFYAKWSKKKYTITYNLNGGKNNSKNPTKYTITSSTIKLKAPKKTNYVFRGWYSDKNFKHRVKTIPKGSTGSVKLYAKWKRNKWTDTSNYTVEYGTPDLILRKAYYEGNTLVVKIQVVNNRMFTADYFDYIHFEFWQEWVEWEDEDEDPVECFGPTKKRSVGRVYLGMGAYSTKTLTFRFKNFPIWNLVDRGLEFDYDYYYHYTY